MDSGFGIKLNYNDHEGATIDEINPYAHQNDNLKVDFEYLHLAD